MRTKFILKIVIFLFLLINVCSLDAAPRMKRACASFFGTDITISWFPYYDTCNAVKNVVIYGRPNAASGFRIIDSFKNSNQFEFVHKNARSTFINGSYFVQYVLDCNGEQIIISDTVRIDDTPPPAIDPDSVSVNDGDGVMGWTASTAADAKGYIIYRTVGTQNFPIDTVFGKNNTFYRSEKVGNPNAGGEKYKIAVLDSCDNVSISGNFHETVFLSVAQDFCKKEVYLSWAPYQGWAGVDRYYIYASSDNGNTYSELGSVLGGERNFTYKTGEPNTNYRFYVTATKRGDTKIRSSSNIVNLRTNFSALLDHIILKNIMIESNSVKLVWNVSAAGNLANFIIKRGRDTTRMDNYQTVAVQANSNDQEFVDANVNVNRDVLYYRIEAYDNCGNLAGISQVSRNIVTTVEKVNAGRLLSWNSYINWPGNVDRYEIYRTFNSNKPDAWFHIFTVGREELSYLDTDSIDDNSNGSICYFIKAIEAEEGAFFFHSESQSNTFCYLEDAMVKIPNALIIDGFNQQFRPVTRFADLSRSSMQIFNRWGQRVFSTTDLNNGWDGKFGGTRAPEGTYYYQIEITGLNNKSQFFSGTFTLL